MAYNIKVIKVITGMVRQENVRNGKTTYKATFDSKVGLYGKAR